MNYDDLIWSSDWDGYKVGYDNINTVGLYRLKDIPEIAMYIDIDNFKILEVWVDDEDNENDWNEW